MREIDNQTDVTEEEAPVQIGLSVATYSPMFAVPEEVVDDAEDGDYQELMMSLADWWDDMTVEERAEAMSLAEKDGQTMAENVIFIDGHNEERDQMEPLAEF